MKYILFFYILFFLSGCRGCRQQQYPAQENSTGNCRTNEQSITVFLAKEEKEKPPLPAKSCMAHYLDSLGFINIAEADSTIAIELMYSRTDNFTGQLLYKDLREAYLHPEAMESLIKAQQFLKELHPAYTLIVYDAGTPHVHSANHVEYRERYCTIYLCIQSRSWWWSAQLRPCRRPQYPR